MHHPWRELRNRGDGVLLFFTTFEDGRVAATLGNRIYLDKDLLQVERRCAIQHEQVHRDLGHTDCETPADEAKARAVTARRLLSANQLIPVALWTQSIEEAADELWVTPQVLEDFIATLTTEEWDTITQAVGEARG